MNHAATSSFTRTVVVLFIMLAALSAIALGQANVKGQWSTLPYPMPINPVHVTLLHNGKVLIVAGSGNCPPSEQGCPSGAPYGPSNGSGAAVWDPVTGNITQMTVAWDMFCNSMVVLADGRVLVNGGTIQYDPFFGELKSSIFDPATNVFTDVQNMAHGRWYPTLTMLGDGRVMTFSGLDEHSQTNQAVEIYTVGSGWSQQYQSGWGPPLYPRMHLLPNGKVFFSGSNPDSALFDPATQIWSLGIAHTNSGQTRTYGSSVLLPLTPANNYNPRVMILGGDNPALDTTEIIDLGAPTLAWQYAANMSQPRVEMNAVILPNGRVLAVGGSGDDEDTTTQSLNADLFNLDLPVAQQLTVGAPNTYARVYHSVALLLPDATVWLAGGNPSRGNYEHNMEVYKPPYLFNADGTLATRPAITSVPGTISYGNPFTVQTPDAANVSSVVLVRPGSPTHAFDQEQRLVGLSFSAGGGTLTVTGPPNGNIAPPGYYMLFILNNSGVPSVASWVQLGVGQDTQPPTAPSNLTATAVGGSQISLSWTASTDNVGVTQYLVERCQGTGCGNFAQVAASAVAAYNDTGLTNGTSYSYRVRATDAAGNLSGYSNVASATAQATTPVLVAAYSFNEGAGTTVGDASGTGNNGTVANTTWTTSGKFGNALVFNGTNALGTIPDAASLHLTNGMTLEAWVNPSTVSTAWRDVMYKGDDRYYLEGTSANSSLPAGGGTWGSSGLAVYGTAALTANTWAHLAVTYDGANLRLYVNGVQVASQARTGNLGSSTNPLQIGGDSLYGQYFKGTIDEVRVYNLALTAVQIQADMVTPIGAGGGGDTQPPTAPSNLTATAVSGSQINLSWTASTDNVGVTQYLVERCQGTGCSNFAQVGTSTGTTYNDTGLTANTSYSYRVRATDAAGNLSPYSNVASATTQNPDTQPPTAPSNLTATAVSTSQINLSWTASTDNVGVTQYLVERCQGTGCSNFAQIGTSAGTTYNDTGLTASTSYSYRVRATDAAGNLSPYSNVASATTQNPDTQPPTAPTNLTATAVSGSQINLGWTASTDNVGVTGYMIERCQGVGCSLWARVAIVPGTTYSDSGLLPNTSYSYQVKATDAAGNFSPYSNIATATTLATIPGLVAAYSFDEGAGTTVTDLSGNGNTGTLTNTTWTSTAKYGNALVFNGTNALGTIPDAASLHLTNGMTLEAWVNPSTVSTAWRDVMYKGDDRYYLEGTSANSSLPAGGGTWGSSGLTIYGTAALTANTWAHLAVTYDGADLRLYVNGTQVASQARTGNLGSSTNPLQIGGDSLYGQYFKGTIDEVRVYNLALTQTQIQSDMVTPVGGGGPLPLLGLSTTTINFGNVATGGASTPQPVTVTNLGGVNLTISSIAISGGNAGDFAQTNNCVGTLAPSGSCTISVTFTPLTTGPRSSTVVINDNAPGSPHSIALSGTGTGFTVSPRAVALTSTMTQQFSANSGNVTWSVDGVVGGSVSTGTITNTGLYSPPSGTGTHTVTATSTDQSQSASASVYVTNYPGTFTQHNDNLRTGQNTNETVLTPVNVNQAQFGKLYSYTLDGIAFASPLYVASVNIPGQGFHNVVYVATEHDSVYAWDADGLSTNPLWQVSFLGSGITPVPCGDTGECGDIPNEIGITGTPVIDQASGTLYVVAKTKEGGNYVQRLHALDIATGAEKFGGPVAIQASVSGSGGGSQGNQLPFDTLKENQRPALVLSNGVLYIGWGSHGDQNPWHGWVMGYTPTGNPPTLQQVMAYCVSPDGYGGGIWASGGGLGADSSGNIYFNTGNGDFTANTGGRDYGDSVVKLGPSGTVLDYFTPYDQGNMEAQDLDLASAGPVLLLDQPGTFPHLLITAAKTGTIYVVNRDDMGHFNPNNNNQIIQSLDGILPHGSLEEGNFSAPAFFNGYVYFAAVNDTLKAFQLSNGLLSNGPTSQSLVIYPNRGGAFAVSGNGNTNGIVWAVQDNNPGNGVLRAYDAGNLANELYNTSQAGTRDVLGVATKFSIPLVANGKVFVGSQSQLVVYGLLP